MDLSAVFGIGLAFFSVVAVLLVQGADLGLILQGGAALLVLGGTLAATLIAFPINDLKQALEALRYLFEHPNEGLKRDVREIIEVAQLARKEGILAVDSKTKAIRNPLFRRGMKYVIDGMDPKDLTAILESEEETQKRDVENAAQVYEGAGAYAPAIGMVGGVLMLIQVLADLSNTENLGTGVAASFVAIVYGVGLSNLVLLPFGNKLRRVGVENLDSVRVVKLGVLGIQEGVSPQFLKDKLETYVK